MADREFALLDNPPPALPGAGRPMAKPGPGVRPGPSFDDRPRPDEPPVPAFPEDRRGATMAAVEAAIRRGAAPDPAPDPDPLSDPVDNAAINNALVEMIPVLFDKLSEQDRRKFLDQLMKELVKGDAQTIGESIPANTEMPTAGGLGAAPLE